MGLFYYVILSTMSSLSVCFVLIFLGLVGGSFVNAWVWRLHEQLDDDGNPKKLLIKRVVSAEIFQVIYTMKLK